jgi:hypothetical protein
MPPIGRAVTSWDARNVYGISGPTRIPMRSTGANPYPGNIFLLSNNEGRKGYSYNLTATIDKAFRNGFAFNANYSYGHSVVLNEGTSSQNNSQWANMEVVDGRNFITLTQSDFDLGHRINAYISKEFEYANKNLATSITFTYNGQSGNPFSYVYRNSPVADNSSTSSNDLAYIPTEADLSGMTFLANTVNGVTYSAVQQKQMLNDYIMGDKYLRKHRGQFAERNGARQPFTHIINMTLEQKIRVKMSNRRIEFTVRYDVFNFTNLLNKDWGRQWFLSFDQFQLYQFSGYVSATNLTPQYRYSPINGTPYGISTSTEPRLSARWISQLTFRVAF